GGGLGGGGLGGGGLGGGGGAGVGGVGGAISVVCPPGSVRNAEACDPCAAGQYCAGGDDPVIPCGNGDDSWDADGDPATACAPRAACAPGSYVASDGSATADRSCAGCDAGTYSSSANSAACAPWTDCSPAQVELSPGTATADRVCGAQNWPPQFGSTAYDQSNGVAVDSKGNVAFAGAAAGSLPLQPHFGRNDAFVRVVAPTGVELWAQQFGTGEIDEANGVAVDANDNVLAVGASRYTLQGLPPDSAGAFVRKYSSTGSVLWTHQFYSESSAVGQAIAVDAAGNSYLAGQISGSLGSLPAFGGADVFLRKLDAAGQEVWSRQFGTAGTDRAFSLAVTPEGGIVVSGYVQGALAEPLAGYYDFFVRKYDSAGVEQWTRQFPGDGFDSAVVVDQGGNVYMAGAARAPYAGQSGVGTVDALLIKLDASGNDVWTRLYGSTAPDYAFSATIDPNGNFLVAGATDGSLAGQTTAGGRDVFVLKVNPQGDLVWSTQIGTASRDEGHGIATFGSGLLYVAGHTAGELPGGTQVGGWDALSLRLTP
ncbi:MAG: hypothetical protein KC492_39070, partial [Myxococcales bacterium]|nr:hypothetical protein [Myxococcales bacterium]